MECIKYESCMVLDIGWGNASLIFSKMFRYVIFYPKVKCILQILGSENAYFVDRVEGLDMKTYLRIMLNMITLYFTDFQCDLRIGILMLVHGLRAT